MGMRHPIRSIMGRHIALAGAVAGMLVLAGCCSGGRLVDTAMCQDVALAPICQAVMDTGRAEVIVTLAAPADGSGAAEARGAFLSALRDRGALGQTVQLVAELEVTPQVAVSVDRAGLETLTRMEPVVALTLNQRERTFK